MDSPRRDALISTPTSLTTNIGGSPGATGLPELLVSPIMRSYSMGLIKATRSPANDLGTTRNSRAPVLLYHGTYFSTDYYEVIISEHKDYYA